MQIDWSLKPFQELSLQELYDILRLRQEVFAVEQECVYNDCDGRDEPALHLAGRSDGRLIAYARILPPGIAGADVAVGRVVSSPAHRGTGLGKAVMKRALEAIDRLYGPVPVYLGAQTHLIRFYEAFGFVSGTPFIEDGIPHTHMIRPSGSR
jgi:ElaA protein